MFAFIEFQSSKAVTIICVCVHRVWRCDNERACASVTWRARLLPDGLPVIVRTAALVASCVVVVQTTAMVVPSVIVVRITTLDATRVVVGGLGSDDVHRDNVIPQRAAGPL